MDIGGDHRAVYPTLLAFPHLATLGISHEDIVDCFPDLSRNGFDRSAEGSFLHPLIGKPDPAEVPITSRVEDMKSEIFIFETSVCFTMGARRTWSALIPWALAPNA
jgi:hypothetical protein